MTKPSSSLLPRASAARWWAWCDTHPTLEPGGGLLGPPCSRPHPPAARRWAFPVWFPGALRVRGAVISAAPSGRAALSAVGAL
eukprot:14144426-Alexandrium_andersonii.AAC.1